MLNIIITTNLVQASYANGLIFWCLAEFTIIFTKLRL